LIGAVVLQEVRLLLTFTNLKLAIIFPLKQAPSSQSGEIEESFRWKKISGRLIAIRQFQPSCLNIPEKSKSLWLVMIFFSLIVVAAAVVL
jgi:hypothetical protein